MKAAIPDFVIRPKLLLTGLMVLVAFTLAQDYLGARLQGTGYYFSESMVFSCFWWVFIPILFFQEKVFRRVKGKGLLRQMTVVLLAAGAHVLMYAALVWLLSGLFFTHQFEIVQTIWFSITSYSYLLILVYGMSAYAMQYRSSEPVLTRPEAALNNTFLLHDGRREVVVSADEIVYVAANSPYVWIHLAGKKLLHRQTLASLELQLRTTGFLRIHKSVLVNLREVRKLQSRQNGDYDLELSNGATVRLSRNYAAAFREAFGQRTQDAIIPTQDAVVS